METANYTPNDRIESPKIRRVLNATIGTAAIVVGAIMAGDAVSADIDLTRITVPVMAVIGSLAGAYNVVVTQPNIPRA